MKRIFSTIKLLIISPSIVWMIILFVVFSMFKTKKELEKMSEFFKKLKG